MDKRNKPYIISKYIRIKFKKINKEPGETTIYKLHVAALNSLIGCYKCTMCQGRRTQGGGTSLHIGEG